MSSNVSFGGCGSVCAHAAIKSFLPPFYPWRQSRDKFYQAFLSLIYFWGGGGGGGGKGSTARGWPGYKARLVHRGLKHGYFQRFPGLPVAQAIWCSICPDINYRDIEVTKVKWLQVGILTQCYYKSQCTGTCQYYNTGKFRVKLTWPLSIKGAYLLMKSDSRFFHMFQKWKCNLVGISWWYS